MGQTKEIKGKLLFKHETEENWNKSSYIPGPGEQVFYDPDENHENTRVKVGDGVKTVNQLSFV